MSLFKRTIPFISSLLILIIFEVILIRPGSLYLFAVLAAIIFFGSYIILGRQAFSKKMWPLAIITLLFSSSGFLLLYFLETLLFKQTLIIVIFIFNWLHFRNYFSVIYGEEEGKVAMVNTFSYINLMTSFMFFSGLLALRIFVNMNLIWLELMVFAVIPFFVYQSFWINEIKIKENFLYLVIFTLVFVECFWVTSFLPTSFLVNGVFLTLLYYVLLNLSRHQILNTLGKKVLARYLILGTSMLFLVLLTAEWI